MIFNIVLFSLLFYGVYTETSEEELDRHRKYADVIYKMSITFIQNLHQCENVSRISTEIVLDKTLNFWNPATTLLRKDFGCVSLCLAKLLKLVDNKLHMDNTKVREMMKAHGANREIMDTFIYIMNDCKESVDARHFKNECKVSLATMRCYRNQTQRFGWILGRLNINSIILSLRINNSTEVVDNLTKIPELTKLGEDNYDTLEDYKDISNDLNTTEITIDTSIIKESNKENETKEINHNHKRSIKKKELSKLIEPENNLNYNLTSRRRPVVSENKKILENTIQNELDELLKQAVLEKPQLYRFTLGFFYRNSTVNP